jgi:hypothetical protein
MRTHILMAAVAASALALAACGGDPAGSAETSADRQKQMQDAALEYARCMREHGVDVPDPKPGGGIRLSVPKGVSEGKVKEAEDACRKYLDAVKPPELSDAQKKEFQEAALAHARCMREHGIDFPDPTFGENGRATIKIGPGDGIDPEDPKFKRAEEACESKLPQAKNGDGPATSESKP